MSWTAGHDAIGITRYDVLRNNVVVASVAAGQGLAYSDTHVPDQQVLTYTVRAYDAAGNSTLSNAGIVRIDSTAVSAPRGVTAPTPTKAAPVLSWQAPVTFAVGHYDIYRDGKLLGATSTPAALSYTDLTAAEGVHDYAVLARDAANNAGVLSASFKVTYDVTAPASGGSPTASVVAGGVSLAWPAASDALSGIAGYVVRRAAGAVPPAGSTAAARSARSPRPPASTAQCPRASRRTASSPPTGPATRR